MRRVLPHGKARLNFSTVFLGKSMENMPLQSRPSRQDSRELAREASAAIMEAVRENFRSGRIWI